MWSFESNTGDKAIGLRSSMDKPATVQAKIEREPKL